MSWAHEFVASLDRSPVRSASERALNDAERRLGVTLPASLRTFYECTDGLQIKALSDLALRELMGDQRFLLVWAVLTAAGIWSQHGAAKKA